MVWKLREINDFRSRAYGSNNADIPPEVSLETHTFG